MDLRGFRLCKQPKESETYKEMITTYAVCIQAI